MGETTNKTLVAALLAWLLARGLRRLIGVALLTGALALGDRRGVHRGGLRRVVRCEARGVKHVAAQLPSEAATSSSSTAQRPPDAPHAIGRCEPQRAPQTPRKTSR